MTAPRGSPPLRIRLAGLEFAKAAVSRSAGSSKRRGAKAAASINAFGVDLYGRIAHRPGGQAGGQEHRVLAGQHRDSRSRWPGPAHAERPRARWTTSCAPTAGRRSAAQLNSLDQELAGHNATWTDEEKNQPTPCRSGSANTAFGQQGYPIEQALPRRDRARRSGRSSGSWTSRRTRRRPGRPSTAGSARQTAGPDPEAARPGERDARGHAARPRQRHLPQGRVAAGSSTRRTRRTGRSRRRREEGQGARR